MDKQRKALESLMEELLAMEPTEAVVEEYNLLAMDMTEQAYDIMSV